MQINKTPLSNLYPRLSLSRVQSNIRSSSKDKEMPSEPPPIPTVSQKVTENPPPSNKPKPKNEPQKKVTIIVPEGTVAKATIAEPIEEPLPVEEGTASEKEPEELEPPSSPEPSWNIDPLPKTEQPSRIEEYKPLRKTQIPSKGEKGTQPKYTLEQRKQMYLNKLSRKSVKKAEIEVSQVNEVLERNEHSIEEIVKEERELKRKLKLVNTAKFFIAD